MIAATVQSRVRPAFALFGSSETDSQRTLNLGWCDGSRPIDTTRGDARDGRDEEEARAGAVAVAALAGGGAAIAASGVGSSEDEQAVIDAAAKKLGVKPEALESALEDALAARIDAAVAAGRLTKEQGAELKERLKEGTLPLFGGRGPGHHGHGFGLHGPELLDTAATFLGMTEAELRTQLEDGKSLAEVAQSKGKSVSRLKTALVDAVEGGARRGGESRAG